MQHGGLVASSGAKVIAAIATEPLEQFYRGRRIPVAAFGSYVVAPEYRGTRIGSDLMLHAERQATDRGAVLGVCYPSRVDHLRHFGWEVTGSRTQYVIERDALLLATRGGQDTGELTVRRWTGDDACQLAACTTAAAGCACGPLARTRAWWTSECDNQVGFRYLIENTSHEVLGQVVYAHENVRVVGQDLFRDVVCSQLACATPAARDQMWRWLAGLGWHTRRVLWWGPRDDLGLMRFGQLAVSTGTRILWMGRVFDPKRALELRGYPELPRLSLDIAIADEPHRRESRFRVVVEHGAASVKRATAQDAARMDIRTFAAIFTGWLSPVCALELGRLSANLEQAGQLEALFAGPAPWCDHFF
jgi:predicted acetyltransferase